MYFDLWPADEGPLRSVMPHSARLTRFYRHLFLWVLQGWLAMFFIGAALAKLSQPQELLIHLIEWPGRVDLALVQWIGGIELALALGLLAPLLSWRAFRPVLLISATGLFVNALAMGGYHAGQGHWAMAAINAVLVVMAGVVFLGRRRPSIILEAGA